MTFRTSVLAGTIAMLLVPTAGAAAAPAGPMPAAGLGTVEHRVTADGTTATSSLDLGGRALEAFDPRRPETLLDAARVLSGMQDEPGAESEAGVASESGMVEDAPYVARDVQVVGDLDGDGIADAVVSTSTYDGEDGHTLLQARRGTDGTVLWEDDGAGDGRFASDAGDVDGDGIDDLLLLSLDVDESAFEDSCDDTSCSFSGSSVFSWTYGLRDGATGTTTWSTTEDGRYDYAERYDFETGDFTSTLDGTNVLAGVDGLDARGQVRLLVSLIDIAAAASYESEDPTGTDLGLVTTAEERSRVRSSTRAAVLSSADGSTVLTRGTTDVSGIAFLQVAGQMVGDATADVLWTTEESTDTERTCTAVLLVRDCQGAQRVDTVVLEVLDGRDLAPVWTSRLPEDTFGFVLALGTDIDGDARADLLALTVEWTDSDPLSGNAPMYTTTLLSGATGTEVWAVQEEDWLFPLAIDDLQGDGTPDLLTALMDFDDESFIPAIRLLRVDGTTGEVLLETAAPPAPAPDPEAQCSFGFGYVGGTADADGDGRADLYGGDVIVASEDCEETGDAAYSLWGESGDDGSSLYRQEGEGIRFGYVAGDLDGDGLGDLLVEDVTGFQGDQGSTVTATTLPALRPLWTTTIEGFGHTAPVGDLDGDGLGEVVVYEDDSTYDDDGSPIAFGNRLRVLRGTDGVALWAAPEPAAVPTVFQRPKD